jgi:hypothetical protein
MRMRVDLGRLTAQQTLHTVSFCRDNGRIKKIQMISTRNVAQCLASAAIKNE